MVFAESKWVENGQIKKIPPAEARRLEYIAVKGLGQFEGDQRSQE